MRCFVTGATGHLGSHLVRLLLGRGEDVAVLLRPSSSTQRLEGVIDRVEVIRGDLASPAALADPVGSWRPEVVFHLAWWGVGAAERDALDQVFVNVRGSIELFEIARAAGCETWIGVGSQAEYGPADVLLTEETPVKPKTLYGAAKASVGLLTAKMAAISGMRQVWLRLLTSYGPDDDEHHLIPGVILALLDRRRPALSRCEQVWDYLYVEDAAEALYRAAAGGEVSGTFNLASGEARSLRDICELARDIIDPKLPLGFGELPYRRDLPMYLAADVSEFRAASGWEPETSLETGIRRTVEFYRARSTGAALPNRTDFAESPGGVIAG